MAQMRLKKFRYKFYNVIELVEHKEVKNEIFVECSCLNIESLCIIYQIEMAGDIWAFAIGAGVYAEPCYGKIGYIGVLAVMWNC